MLALDPATPPRGPAEQFGLELLIDLSRVLRFVGQGDVVSLRLIDGEDNLPIGAWIASGWHFGRAEGAVTVPRALLRLLTTIAGAVREQRATSFDRFGRVPSEANELVRCGLERTPVVSIAGLDLRRAVTAVAGRRLVRLLAPWPEGRRWAVAMSHDLDVVARWPVFTGLRLLELAKKRDFRRAVEVIGAATRMLAGDPAWKGVREILDRESLKNVRSTWFVLCGTPTIATMRAGDLTYLPESQPARRIVSAVGGAAHGIGLHGSFQTYTDAERFREQRLRLAAISGSLPNGVRQHYLRMRPVLTQRAMSEAGFGHDSTFGFADRNGFRLGVADAIPLWSEADQNVLNIDEIPFAWMDRALSKYRGVESPRAWVDDANELAAAARAVEGVWCGIWHPNLTPALGFPRAPQAYAELLDELAENQPLFATTQEIAEWRRARRNAIATGVRADGSVVFHTRSPSIPHALSLEDGQARPLSERPSSSG